MSIHQSLKLSAGMNRVRNVMKRDERVELMQKNGSWKQENSVFGLPKTKMPFRMKKKAAAEKKEEKK